MIDRRLTCLPQPSQMRPPEAETRARDIFRRVSLGVMQPMAGSPRRRRARSVEHRKENQHAARPRIQLERSMRDRAMVPNRRAETAEKYQRHRAQKYRPAWKRVKHQSNRGGNVYE